MGNKHSCCFVPNAQKRNKKHLKYRPDGSGDGENALPRQPSSANLPHISEREPDDTEGDPSLHPGAATMFIVKSVPDLQKKFILKDTNSRRRSQYQSQSSCESSVKGARKCSSCSTIFIDDSTVTQPNHKNTVKAVSLAIYFHIRNREQERLENHWDQNKILDIFDEKQHPLSRERVPNDYDKSDPDRKTIYRFVRTLFSAAQLTAECAIVTLVYLERLLLYAEVHLQPSNWKRITLGAILMASKVWDDQAVWNVDYCQILKDVAVEDMNELERQFLELLQFNINVPSSVYAKYYFDLRALADHHELAFPSEPLSRERAIKLEAISSIYEDKLREKMKAKLKRSNSLDGLTSHGKKAKAILS